MSHTRVKTHWFEEGEFGSNTRRELYCHHNHSCDCITFFNEKGEVEVMAFQDWHLDNNLWDAMNRLWFPYKEKWGEELKDDVEYYHIPPWENKQS